MDELTTQLDELTNNWMSKQTIGGANKQLDELATQLDELTNNWMNKQTIGHANK